MQLEGQDVVKYLSGPNSVRDGALIAFCVQSIDLVPSLTLKFKMRVDRDVSFLTLELHGIQEFGFYHSVEHDFYTVEMVKCLWTDDGHFYLSLDPYDERENFPSDKDNDFFRSTSVKMTVEKAP